MSRHYCMSIKMKKRRILKKKDERVQQQVPPKDIVKLETEELNAAIKASLELEALLKPSNRPL